MELILIRVINKKKTLISMGLSKKKMLHDVGWGLSFLATFFFLTVKKKEGPFSKFAPFFLKFKKKKSKI
jgi:hypothetical protein